MESVELIEGQLPAELEGAYVRTGPNPKLPPAGGYHWFDGDGMIHAVRIAGGKATYCNRWVETARLEQELRAGFPVAAKIGDYRGLSSLVYMALNRLAMALGVLHKEAGLGTANTAIAVHAGKILALHEGDLPYALRIACSGLVETVGRVTYGGKIKHAFTAHPKLDPETQQLFYFGYDCGKAPHCHYGWLEADGTVAADFPVTIPKPVMMHDMALTQNHALILDMPLEFEPKVMVKEGKLPFVFADRPARIGVLPRCASSADGIRWFTAERLMSFHVANAWEEGNTIRLLLCTMKAFSLEEFTAAEGAEPLMTEFTLHLDTGACTVRRFEERAAAYGDFPVVHPGLLGRRTRYTYVACMESDDRGVPRFVGVTKFDLLGGTIAGHLRHGGARLGGEAVFVPRRAGPIAPGSADEDDGWLMTYVTDDDSLQSELVVYDARTMAATPVARLRMPQRVPHGFHGHWVTATQLAAQAAA